MLKSTLIIITGIPGTGKTTLGKLLSDKYHIPFISKDALKDHMFNNLDWSDKDWSRKVSAASHRIMDYVIDEELKAGHSIIVESNFKPHIDNKRFKKVQTHYNCAIVQVLCWADGEVAFKRFMERMGTPARHQGHVEEIPFEQIHQEFVEINGKDTPLTVDGPTVELNTTDVTSIDYSNVYSAIEAALTGD